MKSYWDLSERERSELSLEDVERLLPAERMALGIAVPPPMPREPVRPACPERTWYTIGGSYGEVGFPSLESARAAVRFGAVLVGRDYGSRIEAPHARPIEEDAIKLVSAPMREDAAGCATSLARYQAELNEYDRAKRAHDEHAAAERKALADVWEDWSRCVAMGRDLGRVVQTWHEYLNLCEGDASIAVAFLRRAYSPAQIDDASQWFGMELPAPAEIPPPRKAPVAAKEDEEEVSF